MTSTIPTADGGGEAPGDPRGGDLYVGAPSAGAPSVGAPSVGAGSQRRSDQTLLRADELLPPVEPPSAKFLLQLFVIPAIIVAVVLSIGMAIEWMANRGAHDPQTIVDALRSSSQSRFQKANDLANMLLMEGQYPQLKSNAALAAALGEMLDEMRDQGDDSESAVVMRRIVCGALGQFHVDDGLGALLRAASSDPNNDIRGAAVEAIAVLGQHFGDLNPPQSLDHPELTSTLTTLANLPDDGLRTKTAFALGVLAAVPGSDDAYALEMEKTLEDLCPEARYNAATGFARMGDLRCLAVLIEMLDLKTLRTRVESEITLDKESESSGNLELQNSAADFGQTARMEARRAAHLDLVVVNALKAAQTLAKTQSRSKLQPLATAIEELLAQNRSLDASRRIAPSLEAAAQQLLESLSKG